MLLSIELGHFLANHYSDPGHVRDRNKLRLKHPKLLESTLWLKNFFRGKKCCKKPEEPLLNAPHPLNKNVEKSDGLFEGPFQDEMFQGWLGQAWAGLGRLERNLCIESENHSRFGGMYHSFCCAANIFVSTNTL